eukprot:827973-Pleurochrysis_carterae.AAC.2
MARHQLVGYQRVPLDPRSVSLCTLWRSCGVSVCGARGDHEIPTGVLSAWRPLRYVKGNLDLKAHELPRLVSIRYSVAVGNVDFFPTANLRRRMIYTSLTALRVCSRAPLRYIHFRRSRAGADDLERTAFHASCMTSMRRKAVIDEVEDCRWLAYLCRGYRR